MIRAALALLALLAGVAGAAAADRLVIAVSAERVQITSTYTGDDIVVFGTIERDDPMTAGKRPEDIVVVVRGPRGQYVTRHKSRILGIWVNTDSRYFVDTPSYFAIHSNRPVDQIADLETRRLHQISFDGLILKRPGGRVEAMLPDTFVASFIRLKVAENFYQEKPEAVTLPSPNLFRASVSIPAEAAVGAYGVDVYLFSRGVLLAQQSTHFEVTKTGFEQLTASASRDRPALYGFVVVCLALITGWLASVIFRRD